MPFDAAEYPEDDGATPAEPTPGPLWLRCFIIAMILAIVLMAIGAGWRIADYIGQL